VKANAVWNQVAAKREFEKSISEAATAGDHEAVIRLVT